MPLFKSHKTSEQRGDAVPLVIRKYPSFGIFELRKVFEGHLGISLPGIYILKCIDCLPNHCPLIKLNKFSSHHGFVHLAKLIKKVSLLATKCE